MSGCFHLASSLSRSGQVLGWGAQRKRDRLECGGVLGGVDGHGEHSRPGVEAQLEERAARALDAKRLLRQGDIDRW